MSDPNPFFSRLGAFLWPDILMKLGVLIVFELAATNGVLARDALSTYTQVDSYCDVAGDQAITVRHTWSHGPSRSATVIEFTVRNPASVEMGLPIHIDIQGPHSARMMIYNHCENPVTGCAGSAVTRVAEIESVELVLSAGHLTVGKQVSGTFQVREVGYAPGVSQVGEFDQVLVQGEHSCAGASKL